MNRKVADQRKSSCLARLLRLTLRVVVPILFVALLWHLHENVIRIGYVPSGSMEPTLLPDDRILIRLDAYREHGPDRGDIIVYRGADGAYYVKRVIGTGGDLLGIAQGHVWLNDGWLAEPYLKEQQRPERPFLITVEQGRVFVLGDNRNFSEDSRDRDVGTIPLDLVLGKVTHVIWPRERAHRIEPVHYK